jgi:hypothetical protein
VDQALWRGKPDTRRFFTRSDLFLVPLGLVWAALAVPAVLPSLLDEPDVLTTAVSVFFVTAAFYLNVGRHVFKWYRKRQTTYLITASTAEIHVGRTVTTLPVDQLPALSWRIARDGSGDIVFAAAGRGASLYTNTGLDFLAARYGGAVPGFYDVQSVAEPLAIIVELQRGER